MAIFREQYIVRGKTVTIRNATPEDAGALIDYINAVDRETTYLSREPGEFDMTQAQEAAFLRDCMERENYRYAIAEIDDEIVGMCNAVHGTRLRYRHVAELGISVRKAYWRGGIGQLLMKASFEWLRARGVERLQLQVDTQNLHAIALYHKLGFTVEGAIIHERKMPDGTYRDAYHMGKDL